MYTVQRFKKAADWKKTLLYIYLYYVIGQLVFTSRQKPKYKIKLKT